MDPALSANLVARAIGSRLPYSTQYKLTTSPGPLARWRPPAPGVRQRPGARTQGPRPLYAMIYLTNAGLRLRCAMKYL